MKIGRLKIEWMKKPVKQELHERLREELADSVGILTQPAFQQGLKDAGFKVDWNELAHRLEDASDWKSDHDVFIKYNA